MIGLLVVALLAAVCRVTGIPDEHGYFGGQVATCDLDGDGVVDSTTVTFTRTPSGDLDNFRVVVAGHAYEGTGEALDSTFAILDVDTTDAQLEIAISEQGPSDDYATTILAYREGRIVALGKLEGSPELHADGSGVIRTKNRAATICTWWHDAEYRIGASGTLEEVPRDRYYMGMSVAMKKSLTLPASDGKGTVRLHKGDRVTLESTDDRSWVNIRTESGKTARCPIDDEGKLTNDRLDSFEVFDGLSFAD